jgi:kynurenine formamidase
MPSFSYSRILSLSHVIHPAIPQWQGDPPIEFESVAALDREGYYLRRLTIGEHSATHMNAPNSFFVDGAGIDTYAPASLVVPAVVVDIREQAAKHPDYRLRDRDVHCWEQQQGQIPAGCVVLLYTGWQAKWPDPDTFLNLDDQGIPHFPGFSAEVTQFLLAERAIAGIGIDTHGVDGGSDTTFATNRQVLARQGIVLECLTNLNQLPAIGTQLVIAPLPLQNGSGSPASVLAFVP